jgi:hypothetical protein
VNRPLPPLDPLRDEPRELSVEIVISLEGSAHVTARDVQPADPKGALGDLASCVHGRMVSDP